MTPTTWCAGILAAVAALAVGCANPPITGLPCSADGLCLPGFRCRAQLCIPVSAEICDGEDNDGNGFVDEGLFGIRATSVPLPEPGDILLGNVAIAARGRDRLLSWIEAAGSTSRLVYTLVDEEGTPSGRSGSLPLRTNQFYHRLSAIATSAGYSVALAERTTGARSTLQLVRIDAQASTATIQSLGTFGNAPETRIADSPGGEVIAMIDGLKVLLRAADGTVRRVAEGVPDPGYLSLSIDEGRIALGWVERHGDGLGGTEARAQIRLFSGSLTASTTLEGADALDLTWHQGRVVAVWHDPTDALHPRVILDRFGDRLEGQQRHVLDDNAASLRDLRIVASTGEVAVAWSNLFEQGEFAHIVAEGFLARASPVLGRNGPVLRLGEAAMHWLEQLVVKPAGYETWLIDRDARPLRALQVEAGCGFVPDADGGAPDGGALDGGALDGGAPGGDGGAATDGGIAEDGGAATDGGVADDGGVTEDGGIAADGGSTEDGGPPDGGVPSIPSCDPADGGPSVTGEIRWFGGAPAAGLVVVVGSCRAKTSDTGRFEAGGLSPPFDLTVIVPDGTASFQFTYLELQTATPIIEVPAALGTHTMLASGTHPGGTGRVGRVHIFHPGGSARFPFAGGTFEEPMVWNGPDPTPARALALEWDFVAQDFTGAQDLGSVDLADGTFLSLGELAVTPLASSQVRLSLPESVVDATGRVLLTLAGSRSPVHEVGGSIGPWDLPLPGLPAGSGATLHLEATVELSDGSGATLTSAPVGAGTSEVQLSLPSAAPVILSPEEGATAVGPTPSIRFSRVLGARYHSAWVFVFSADRVYFVFGTSSPMRIPDLRFFGLEPPAEVPADALVAAHFGGPTYAEVAAGAPALPFNIVPLDDGQLSLPSGTSMRSSVQRSFSP